MSLITNKKAQFNYEILEKYTAGIELFGFEVKSLKGGHGSLEGAHVTVRGNEVYLIGMFIPPYQPNNTPKNYDPYRNRRLLLNKNEINSLQKVEKTKGLTIVPTSVYNKQVNKRSRVKIDIASVKGKKKFDKRETLKKRDIERETRRQFSDK